MILQILGTLFVVLLIYLIQKWYLQPKRTMDRYAQFFKAKGYRVCLNPYSLLHNQYYFLTNKNSKGQSKGDPFKNLKEVYPNYDVIITNMLNRPLIQLCSPELIKDFYAVDKHYSFPKQRKSIGTYTRILGNGLVFSEDKQWKRKRSILNRVFNFDFLKSQTNNIANISDKCVEEVERKIMVVDQQSKKKIIQIDVLQLLMQIFSEVMLKIFLGMSNDQRIQGQPVANFIKILMDDATIAGYQLLSLLFGQKFMNLGLRKMDRSIKRRVKLYRNWAIPFVKKKIDQIQLNLKKNPNKTHPSDIIQALIMEKYKENNETYGSITSSEQLVDEFTTFFFAGTQTTSNYLQIMINSIVKNPSIEKKLRQQIAKYMSTDDYSYENLKNFTYIDNIQKETNRMYGPAIFLFYRMAKQDNYLGDLPVKKNTMLSLVNLGNQLSDKYFKNPLQFRPQRWDDECKDLPNFVLGGFSFGGRSCIGKHLAMIESKIVLIKFMKRYQEILLPNNDFKLEAKFIFCSQTLKTKLIRSQ